MTQSLKKLLVVLPLSLFLLTGCGDDAASSGDNGSESAGTDDGSEDASTDDDSAGGISEGTDLCSLVSDETLTASALSATDGVQKEWVGHPACVYGEELARRIIVQVDHDNSLGPIEEGDDGVEMIDGHPVGVEYDSEMTCLLEFTVGPSRINLIVEDLFDAEKTPGEPCDAGYPALEDVLEKTA